MRVIIYFFCLALLVAGCSSGEKEQATSAVLSYNAALSESYGSGVLDTLLPLVTSEQAAILSDRVRDFEKNGIRLTATLRSISFSEIKELAPGDMEAVTDESWDFRYVHLLSDRVISEISPHYIGRYSLVSSEGRWLVAKVAVQPVEGAEKEKEAVTPTTAAGADLSLEDQVRNTVLTYLVLLGDGYRNQNMTPLLHSATRKRADKAYYHMSSLGEGQVKMNPRLLEIKIPLVHLVGEEQAEVSAIERWDYVYYRTDSGKKVYENQVSYELKYILVRDQDQRWLVDDITVEKTEEGKGEGELRFYERPPEDPSGRR